ncbi:MAG: DUF3488 domain-containing protein [Candidatus Hydrogenedentes bacterium]|nr:DUF3488 domain-containing protein [Candidatus Hydrogenedentota bacterium]
MPSFSLRTVRISLAIMTLSGYLALATTAMFGPEITLIPLALISVMRMFERLDETSAYYQRISQIISLAFTIVIVPYLFTDLILGLTAVVIYIQIHLFLHKKGVKEYRYLFLMAFFLLVDAVAQSPDSAFGLVVPIFIISAVWAFASVQIYAEAEANKNGNIADLLPAEHRRGFLPPEVAQWVSGQRRDQMSVAPVLSAVSIGCVVATLLFFLFTPRLDAGIFGRNNTITNTATTGLDDRVNLAAGGNIAADEAPVFLARFPEMPQGEEPFPNQPLYWRVTSYNRLVGAEWDRVGDDFVYIDWRSRAGRIERADAAGQASPAEATVVQEIFLQDTHNEPGIPALANLIKLFPSPTIRLRLDDRENQTFRVVESTSEGVTYRAESRIPFVPRERLVAASGNYARGFDGERLMDVFTDARISERARALATSLTDSFDSPYEKAEAIEAYLRDPSLYSYTTSLESLSSADPVDDFLFNTRRGHCELFASSMCMMLRSIGVPSRVASGYRDGDWSAQDGAYIVRKRHAHLWVEVYLNSIGWYPFDPSGEAELDNSAWAVFMRMLGRYSLMARYVYYRDVIGYSSGLQLGNIVNFSIGLFRFDVDLMRSSLPTMKFFSSGLPAFLILLCIAIAIVWGFLMMYRSASLKRRAGPGLVFSDDQIRATRIYGQLKRRLLALGVNGHAASARELVDEVKNNPDIDAEMVTRIVRAYNDARFGGRPLKREAYRELAGALKSIKRDAQTQ